MLGSVAAISAPGLVARIVSLLQDKLLSLELRVLITHPAEKRDRNTEVKCAGNDRIIPKFKNRTLNNKNF